MNKMESAVKITAKLYECRDAAKGLFKEAYFERLKPYTDIIRNVMKANNEDEMKAVLRISKTHTFQESAIAQMMFFAAIVEMIEPSKDNPKPKSKFQEWLDQAQQDLKNKKV